MKNNIDNIHYEQIKNLINSNDLINFKNYISINNIDLNSNFSRTSNNNDTIVFYTVRKSKIDFLKYLMTFTDIKIDIPNNHTIPIMHAIANKKEEIFDILMKHPCPGLKYDGEDEGQKLYPLTRAAQARNLRMVKAIAEHPDNDWKLSKNTPLFYAFSNKQTEMGLYIINHPEFDPYEYTSGRDAFKFICDQRNTKGIKAFLNLESFDPNESSRYKNYTAQEIKKPVWWNIFNFVELKNGQYLASLIFNHPKIDINRPDKDGKRLIEHHLTISNQYDTFKILLEQQNLDINFVNNDGKTIIEELLGDIRDSDFLKEKNQHYLELLVNKIIEKSPELLEIYCEKIINLSPQTSYTKFALSTLRHVMLDSSLKIKKSSSKTLKI